MSFRGASGDEESRSALKTNQSEILRFAQDDSEGVGMTKERVFLQPVDASIADRKVGATLKSGSRTTPAVSEHAWWLIGLCLEFVLVFERME